MRYELYEVFEGIFDFICESDIFSEIIEKAEGNNIVVDNKTFTIRSNLQECALFSDKKNLIFACKLSKACADIKDIKDDYIRVVNEKEEIAKEESAFFFLNMK